MRPYLDVLMRILLMQDTCQHHRLLSSLKGISIMVPSICQISHSLLSSVLFSIVCFHKSVPLPRVHTPLRRSTDDHPARTVSLSEESLPLHKIFSQSMQHVSVHNCDWARQKALWSSNSPCVSIARITQWSFLFVYRCQLMQHLLHEDTYLKQPWQAAIQWLHYEMERVSCGGVCTTRIGVLCCCCCLQVNHLAITLLS